MTIIYGLLLLNDSTIRAQRLSVQNKCFKISCLITPLPVLLFTDQRIAENTLCCARSRMQENDIESPGTAKQRNVDFNLG